MPRPLLLIAGLFVVSLVTGCAFNVAHSNPEPSATPAAPSTIAPTDFPTVPVTLDATAPATDTPTPIAIIGQAFTTASREAISRKLLDKTNRLRTAVGLPAYTMNQALNAAAQDQAAWMAATGEASHVRPDGSKPATRAALAGYPNSWSVTEIIYIGGIATEDHAWDFWTTSSVHYAQLTSPRHQEAGIGMAHSDTYGQAYVMIFGIAEGVMTVAPTALPMTQAATFAAVTPARSTPTATYRIHIVQRGETLYRIALKYGVPLDKLIAVNGIRNPARIEVGQQIIIP